MLGSLFDSALKYKNNIKIGLKKQKNLLDKMPNQEIDEMDGTHGVRTSIDLFKRMYYFPGMGPYIKACCETCERCQISTSSKALMAPLHPIELSYPGVVVHLDSTKGGPLTERGYSHILAIIEAFSGHVSDKVL